MLTQEKRRNTEKYGSMRFFELKRNFNVSTRSKLMSARLNQKALHMSTIFNIYTPRSAQKKISVEVQKCAWKKWTDIKQLKLKTSASHTADIINHQRRSTEQG